VTGLSPLQRTWHRRLFRPALSVLPPPPLSLGACATLYLVATTASSLSACCATGGCLTPLRFALSAAHLRGLGCVAPLLASLPLPLARAHHIGHQAPSSWRARPLLLARRVPRFTSSSSRLPCSPPLLHPHLSRSRPLLLCLPLQADIVGSRWTWWPSLPSLSTRSVLLGLLCPLPLSLHCLLAPCYPSPAVSGIWVRDRRSRCGHPFLFAWLRRVWD
jgi:hypothetical protein